MLDKLFIAILNWSATLKINILFCPLCMFSELHYLTPCCKPKWKSKQQKSVGRCCISASIPTFCSKILVCRIPFPWVIQFITNDSAPAIILRQWGRIRVSFDLTLWITDLESHTPKATGAWAVLQEEVYWFNILNKTLRRKDYCKRSADYPAGSWRASEIKYTVQTPEETGLVVGIVPLHWDCFFALRLCHIMAAIQANGRRYVNSMFTWICIWALLLISFILCLRKSKRFCLYLVVSPGRIILQIHINFSLTVS